MLDLARQYGVDLPRDEPEALADFMNASDTENLEQYLEKFSLTLSVMQTAGALERIAYELMEDAAGEGIRYIEVRFSPVLNTASGLAASEAVEAALRGIERAQNEFAIIGRLIICAIRSMSPGVSLELAKLAVAYRASGVVAFDLAGAERGYPASAHAEAFGFARLNELACTVHAGESDGVASLRQAVHLCGANRLGHATRLLEDSALAQYVDDRRIALEICLTSNVQTRVIDRYEVHPLRQLFEQGHEVTLNTDNRLISGVTLTDEYVAASEHLGFTFDELALIAMNGFRSAFLPWQARLALLAAARVEIAALAREA